MNTPLRRQRIKICSPKSILRWHLSLAGLLSFLCFGVGLILPPIKNEAGNNFPMPRGQLQADTRTLVAALRYLLEPVPDIAMAPAAFSGSDAAFTLQALRRTSVPFAYSNQTGLHPGSLTNRPARS